MAYNLDNYAIGEVLTVFDKNFDPNISIGGAWERCNYKILATAYSGEQGGTQHSSIPHIHLIKARLPAFTDGVPYVDDGELGIYDFEQDKWGGFKESEVLQEDAELPNNVRINYEYWTFESISDAMTYPGEVAESDVPKCSVKMWRRVA